MEITNQCKRVIQFIKNKFYNITPPIIARYKGGVIYAKRYKATNKYYMYTACDTNSVEGSLHDLGLFASVQEARQRVPKVIGITTKGLFDLVSVEVVKD